jgi:hypothetical protein
MAVAFVQSAKYTGTAAQTNMTFTLGTTPVVGNTLYMICMYWTGDNPFLVPSGWTLADKYEQTTTGIAVIQRTVQSGDTTSWNLTVLSVADQNSGEMVEVSGVNGTLQFSHVQGTGTSVTGASVTPSTLNTLAFAFVMSMTTAGSDTTVTPSGYTKDQAILSSFQPGWGFHKTALTADTTTALTPAVTGLPSGTNAMTQMLVPGAGAASPKTPKTLALMGTGA